MSLARASEIDYIHQMLKMGTGADRQLKVFEETGDLKKVVDYMVAETRVGVFEDRQRGSKTLLLP